MKRATIHNELYMKPLALRLRPQALDDVLGQKHILSKDAPFRISLERGQVSSTIFWGPPGCGKTTLARIMSRHSERRFVQLSAVNDGMSALKKYIQG